MKQFWVLVLFVLLAVSLAAQQSKRTRVFGVTAGRVLDFRTGKYSSDEIIWIENDRIKAVGKVADIERQMPAGATTISLPNATILPGLVDCHVHLTLDPNLFGPNGLHTSLPRSALIGARNARITLEAGFTTVRNVAADGYADVAFATQSMQTTCQARGCSFPAPHLVLPAVTGTKISGSPVRLF